MSVTKTSHPVQTAPSRLPEPHPAPSPRVDTSNLTPGAAARFEKLMRSIDDFAAAVGTKAIMPPTRK